MDVGSGGTLEMDRLSKLPDAVLCHVLSFLPTKYSVRTTILSTRWNYLFASVPIIDCDDSLQTLNLLNKNKTFIHFVTRALHLVTNRLSHITTFRIRNHRYPIPISVVRSWVLTALRYNVKEIEFYSTMMGCGPLPMPIEVFTSQTLVTLKLNVEMEINLPDCVCLPNLNTLLLGPSVSIDEESLRKLLSICPLLEELFVLCKMKKAKIVDISVPSLHYLSLNICGSSNFSILLNTPNLETLCCESYASMGYYGVPSSSMKMASINVSLKTEEETEKTKICELLKLVCETRFLFIDGDVLEALELSNCSIPIFDNLTYLELSNNYRVGWEILPALLEASPHLVVLVLEWGFLDDDEDRTGFCFLEPDNVPECLSLCLEKVIFKIFLGEEPEYEFIEYLLRNSEVLKEIIVHKDSCIGSDVELSDLDEEIQLEMEEYIEIGKKLLSFPRRSRACRIVFDAVPMTRDAFVAASIQGTESD